MATVSDPRFRALDSSGNAYVGATLTVYTAGTTTPASIYRDASLTVAMTNPTTGADKSGADGYFPQVFAAEGQTFDVVVKNSSGTTLWSLVNVPSLGSETGTFTRDFGSGGRLRAAGSAGVVRVEGGDPTGDDIGGQITIGGYAGTQADVVKLDGLSVDTTGTFTENGKGLQGVVYTPKTAFTAVSTVVIALPNNPVGVLAWDIDIFGVTLSAGGNLSLTASTNGGSSYLAAGYGYDLIKSTAGAVSATSGAGTATFPLANSMGSVGTIRGRLHIYSSQMDGLSFGADTGSTQVQYQVVGGVGSTVFTHIKLAISAGTMTGNYRVVPLRGFN